MKDQSKCRCSIRSGMQTLIEALEAKRDATDKKTGIVVISINDLQELIDALKTGVAELPTTLPFGL